MINWDELKHIHVIRKLEEILGSWFNTAIIMVDHRGHIRNYSPNAEHQSKNRLCQMILQAEGGFDFLEQYAHDVCDKIGKQDKPLTVIDGPFNPTQALAAKVAIDREFLGAVICWPFLADELTAVDKKNLGASLSALNIDAEDVKTATEKLHAVTGENLPYMKELVELVAQEIETFHKEITSREERISELNNELGTRYRYDNMIGKAKPMQDIYLLLDKIRNSDSTVMVWGENGTGKELIARAIHYNSLRKDKVFVTVNCSAFNENLLDSELFGHIRGAFTGAVRDKKGLFEAADGGTLFLDEIGDMSPSMQVKLLRVLQEGTILPVGSTSPKKVDVRVVTATNKDLRAMVENGEFREDLYYRLNVININVPALRERKEDIPLLVDHFLDSGCKEKNVIPKRLTKRALEKVFDFPWPGNIRELENEIERLIVLANDDSRIGVDLLSPRIREHGETSKVQGVRVAGKLKDALEELERTMIKEGLKRTGWNKSRLAKELGISRAGLIMKVDKYGLDKRKAMAAMDNRSGDGGDKGSKRKAG